jgi:electron transport complex protein RnfG
MSIVPEPLKPAAILVVFATGGAALLAGTHWLTADRIAEEERRTRLASLYEIVPRESHTNDMLTDTIQVTAPDRLGTSKPVTVYRARRDGEPHAVVMEVVAPDGYSGPIRLLVGIHADGTLAGVRVVSHKETPGLGDFIETGKSDWIRQFKGLSLGNPPREEWAVEKDGGAFDQMTGATITPRAVVQAIRRALLYFRANRESLFAEQAAPDD